MGLPPGYDACMETTEAPPTILNNLATVLDYTERDPAGNGFLRNGYAVCHRTDDVHPYVVWVVAQQSDGTWEASSGRYCNDVVEAVKVYCSLTGRE